MHFLIALIYLAIGFGFGSIYVYRDTSSQLSQKPALRASIGLLIMLFWFPIMVLAVGLYIDDKLDKQSH